MNKIFSPPRPFQGKPATTQAGDGLPRRKWTSEEVQRMLEAGIIAHRERFELIGGDLIAMAARGNHHERVKIALTEHLIEKRPPEIRVAQETTLHLSENDEPEPELIVYPASMKRLDVRGETVLLVVEISGSSLRHDKTLKARLYATFGVREYWVIDAVKLTTTVHLDPAGAHYENVKEYSSRKLLTPQFAPELAVRLGDLKYD